MDNCGPGTRMPRDAHGHCNDLADSVYGMLPSHVLHPSSADMRAPAMPSKRDKDAKSAKRKGTSDSDDFAVPSISLARFNGRGYCITTKPSKRGRLQTQKEAHMELHQSTCLNFSGPENAESDLWILPDFDEWEFDADALHQQPPLRKDADWAPLVERAAHSNRERLRRRLEGDGWDFVGGKYGEDEKVLHAEAPSESAESVDEEFDVVVLPVVQVSC